MCTLTKTEGGDIHSLRGISDLWQSHCRWHWRDPQATVIMYHEDPRAAQIILDSVADGVFTVDLDWKITSFNSAAEQITGVPRGAANGRPCCDVLRSSICENDCALKKTLESDQPIVNQRVFIVDANGQRLPVSISTAVLRDRSGAVIGGVATFRDLSLIESLRAEIRQHFGFADIIGRSAVMEELF